MSIFRLRCAAPSWPGTASEPKTRQSRYSNQSPELRSESRLYFHPPHHLPSLPNPSILFSNIGDDGVLLNGGFERRYSIIIDSDARSIQGTEGENVVITLEENPSAGHEGEQATLILQNGNSTLESTTRVRTSFKDITDCKAVFAT